MKLALAVVVLLALVGQGRAHTMPNSTLIVENMQAGVLASVSIPVSELEAALGRPVSLAGAARVVLESYVRAHIALTAADGQIWPMGPIGIEIGNGEHPTLALSLAFSAPPGAGAQPTVLRYDAVNHRIASHYVLVYRRNAGALQPLGRLQSPAAEISLNPLRP